MRLQPLRQPKAITEAAGGHLEEMRVGVDEARKDDAPRGVDDPPGVPGRPILQRPDRYDPVPDDVDEARLEDFTPVAERKDRPAFYPDVGRSEFGLIADGFYPGGAGYQ